ncbi:hypothetical protein SAMN06297422_11689 [Lachnospiraceae bacterium]|nr:hypothetical protein SAMN06297422_11689 [Lachnospiraceae bacterium]
MMKFKINKKYIAAVLTLIFCLSTLSCGRNEAMKASPEDTVFTFAGENISLGEVYLYANTVKEDYEATYGKDVWNIDVSVAKDSSVNMEDVTRKDIIEDIIHVKLLALKANEYKCALTEEEAGKVASQTDAFYSMLTDEQIRTMDLSYDMIQSVMQENAIAKKVYDLIISDAGIEVSDEDARETTFYDLYFECYTVASSGDVTKLSEDEREAQYERALQAYNTLINPIESSYNDGTSDSNPNSTNIEGLAEYYGLHNSSYYTMTPSEIEGIYGKDIMTSLYNLDDGSYSLVTESEYGYHIFYMKALTDREATDKRKNELIVSKRRQYIESHYSEWQKEADPKFSYEDSVDFDVYDSIIFN